MEWAKSKVLQHMVYVLQWKMDCVSSSSVHMLNFNFLESALYQHCITVHVSLYRTVSFQHCIQHCICCITLYRTVFSTVPVAAHGASTSTVSLTVSLLYHCITVSPLYHHCIVIHYIYCSAGALAASQSDSSPAISLN